MPTVLYEVRDRVAFITLNRPEKLNAIDAEMRRGLFQAFREVKRDPEVWAGLLHRGGAGLLHQARPGR